MASKRLEIQYGNHAHRMIWAETGALIGAEPCIRCELENKAFVEMVKSLGAHYVEDRMHRLESYRAYNQKWPFDAREKVLSTELVFEDANGAVYVDGYSPMSTLDRMMDEDAVDLLLIELTADEREVIEMSANDYKPREIAAEKGHKTSAKVRQDKYAAMRKLGAPINRNMRRGKGE